MCGFIKPEIRNLAKHFALAGDRVGQYYVECRESVARDHQQTLIIKTINIANFATVQQGQAGQVGSVQSRRHKQVPEIRLTDAIVRPMGALALLQYLHESDYFGIFFDSCIARHSPGQ